MDSPNTREQLLWVIISGLAVIFCAILTEIVWDKFRHTPSIIVIDTTNYPIYNIPYPGVTLCNSNLVYKPAVESLMQNMSILGINESTIMKFVLNLPLLVKPENADLGDMESVQKKLFKSGMAIKDIMKEMMQPCEKMLVKCRWRSEVFECMERFHVIRSVYGHCCAFNYHGGHQDESDYEVVDTELGSGDSEDGDDDEDEEEELRVSGTGMESALSVIIDCEPQHYTSALYPFYGITVLVHDATDYPETSMVTALLQPGESLSAALGALYIQSEENIRDLKLNLRKCWFDDELTQNSTDEYSYQTCITECRMDAINKKCGCVPYYYPFTGVKFRICDFKDVSCLYKYSRIFSGVQPAKGTAGFNNSEVGLSCNICLPQCTDEYYTLTTRVTAMSPELYRVSPTMRGLTNPNLSVLHVYFPDLNCIKYRRYSYMTWDELFAAFGGVFGLCLGGSVLSMIEVVYYFTLKLWQELTYDLKIRRKTVAKKVLSKWINQTSDLKPNNRKFNNTVNKQYNIRSVIII